MRKIIILCAAVFLALSFSLSDAGYPVRPVDPLTVEVVGEEGGAFQSIPYKSYRQGGTHIVKKYLEASKGQNYTIIVRNRTSGRIGVVVAVDGRNIISGKQSNLNCNEQMYLIDPHGYAKFQGWRTDSATVHKFYFTDVADSYSVRTFSDTSAMGIIAVAAYREKVKHPHVYREPGGPIELQRAPAGSAPKRSAGKSDSAQSESAGTGFGESVYAPVERVEFKPAATPAQKILIKYEWRSTLCKKRLISCEPKPGQGNRLWDDGGYAPHPPDYQHN
jgi:hypothetical protein